MAELREHDFRAALDLVGEVHDAQDREEFRSILLPGYRALVPALHVSYNEIVGGAEVAVAIVEPEMPEWAVAAWSQYAEENPLLRRYLRTRDGRALRFSDVISRRDLSALPLYRSFYRPLGVEHQIAFVLPSTPALTIGIALTRAEEDFSDRDRTLLELTRPHVIQAYRAAELRERLAATVGALRAGFDADRTAIVLLERDGAVSFASGAAEELLGGGGEALAEGDPLPRALAEWVDAGEPSGRIEVGSASLLVRRLRSDGRIALILGEAGRALSLEALAELGLTPREAVVLHRLACGVEPDEVAADLGIAPRTVAKHMQRIHIKLGVTNRAQAMATAWAAVTYAPARTSLRTG